MGRLSVWPTVVFPYAISLFEHECVNFLPWHRSHFIAILPCIYVSAFVCATVANDIYAIVWLIPVLISDSVLLWITESSARQHNFVPGPEWWQMMGIAQKPTAQSAHTHAHNFRVVAWFVGACEWHNLLVRSHTHVFRSIFKCRTIIWTYIFINEIIYIVFEMIHWSGRASTGCSFIEFISTSIVHVVCS